MSTRKYKNPVNNHFIYNDETRKSTCKICYFDMAGRHSENLMRHLKRKHSSTYAEVMLEKQRRRSTIQQQKEQSSSENNACQLSSLFSFETEPHGLRIKSMPTNRALHNKAKKRVTITIALKHQIVEKHKQGLSVTNLGRAFKLSKSTISTILKNADKLKHINASKGVSRISSQRPRMLDDVERLLLLWMDENQIKAESSTRIVICEKAKKIFDELIDNIPATSTLKEEVFKASKGWFENFKKRSKIQGIEEAANSESNVVNDINRKTKPCSIEIDTNDVNPTQSGQFESVYLGKFEMREDTDETLSQMPDNKDNNNKHNEEKLALAVRNETKAKATTPNPSSVAAAATTAPSCSSAQTATNSEKQLLLPQQSSSDDDGFFLQYLGNKFSKYTPNAKHTVQFHINRILYKADMGCYDNITDASKLPDVE
ncbi:CG14050 [Drosophila busckii]|uniref:CG14050 n=1 Tax=Drosophila busckii TaxID=30019 RepID=A0A0M5J6A7_DROBS|nr:CG14050 [Drosophila busckii]